MTRELTCREFLGFLDDYLARALDKDSLAAFEKHLSDCPACVAYLQTYQQAIRLGQAVLRAADDPVPEAVPEELVRAILAARERR
ncbi:MAG TPA: zf-HC2 domain-containing protein [Vicinamibacteria bacterium]|nr:zf-HC2 domain-containing protein [Vicinamibacteria bacterium]